MYTRLFALLLCVLTLPTWANQCKTVNFGVVDWTDVRVTTAVAQVLLEKLGYDINVSEHSVDGIYEEMASGNLDVFLGNWMPTMASIVEPHIQQSKIESLSMNLDNAKYTLAVPSYVYDAGVKTFADLAKHKDKFDGRIYGLEKGNDGNLLIQKMIDKNDFGLKPFRLYATSERIMLAQVKRRIRDDKWIAFLAWTPHPMNTQHDIRYLAGGDEYFGPNYGGSTVHTNTRKGLASSCPNVARFLNNLKFNVKMEGQLMGQVMNEFIPADRAVRDWMHKNPKQVSVWLKGVTQIDGSEVDFIKIAQSLKLSFDS